MLQILLLVTSTLASKIILVGGAQSDDNPAYNKFIEWATTETEQYIGVVTASSAPEDAQDNGFYYVDILTKLGVKKIDWIPLHLNNPNIATDKTWVDKASKMTGIFFGGGDQLRYIKLFYTQSGSDTPLLAAIRERVENNKCVVSGTSAGLMIMSGQAMLTGGVSYYGLAYPLQTTSDPKGNKVSYEKKGFGFLKSAYIDCHFSQRNRQARLIRLVSDFYKTSGVPLGIGVDEDTALAIDNGHAIVLGQGGVSLFDLSQAQVISDLPLSIKGIKYSYLTAGDEYNVTERKLIRWDCDKTHLDGHEKYDKAKNATFDLFSDPGSALVFDHQGMFTDTALDLADSKVAQTRGYTKQDKPLFRVWMTKSAEYKSYYSRFDTYMISFEGMTLDIEVVNNS